jgi:septum formation protein
MKIILASRSPKRKEFLEMLGLEFEIIPSRVDERSVKESDPVKLAKRLARMKAEDVAKRLDGEAVVIGADTLVSFNGRIIGKARDRDHAYSVLKEFSGKEHQQITGICIINIKTGKTLQDHSVTKIMVKDLNEDEIESYIQTGEPMEGSGCYTPLAHMMLFDKIEGSWTNIVGLPMEIFIPLLTKSIKDGWL